MSIKIDHQQASRAFFAVKEADITPPLAIYARNWGAAAFDNAQGIHRPLVMQCFIIGSETGELGQVILTADLGWWKNSADEVHLRSRLLKKFSLQESQLLFCLSHTHAGPSLCSADREKPGGEYIEDYLERLYETAVSLIQQANNEMAQGTIVWGYGVCDLATKRDLHVGNEFLVGYDPTATADDTLVVGLLRWNDGKPGAIFVNYACHPTTFAYENTLLSPDFVGAMREVVENQWKVPTLFLQGASGDLAPKEQYVSDPAIVDRHGRKLGYAVLSTIEGFRSAGDDLVYDHALPSGAPLAIWKTKPTSIVETVYAEKFTVTVDYKKLPDLLAIEKEYLLAQDRVMKDRLWRKLNTRLVIGEQEVADLPLWVWQIGEIILVAQPNEAYSYFQLELRKSFPHKIIVVVNIANGYVGYLPPKELYSNDMYAVWQTPYAAGSLEKLTTAAQELIVKHCDYETRIS
ncbi:neutral/alkaline non-lysosomal ceramidase N-terminal domain-containing protein [Sphingobacterium sp. LRF_L2]|uniref:neutral/alkaline non-lysosomal ceramidase N-terminal domain-containing protein n=1 Tax=Sphingobacterium sp. LRF_L2 TaxID=3369421 RepID=UPI003F62E2F5